MYEVGGTDKKKRWK